MVYYVGSGPYCYANSLAMTLGADAPAPRVIETLTGSAFGVELLGGSVPFFDPLGWDPEIGLDAAIGLLGYTCERSAGGTPDEAVARLRAASAEGPVLVGPVEMGLLLYHPGSGTAIDADHYVTVVGMDGDTVVLHDPHAFPYATLPVDAFVASWRAETVVYTNEPFVMRSGFVRQRVVAADDALRQSLPAAARWLAGRDDIATPPGSLGGAAAVDRLADLTAAGLPAQMRTLLEVFSVRVGVRRLVDAAACLDTLGHRTAAAIATEQARLLGSLQHPLVVRDDVRAEAVLRKLAPTYEQLHAALTRTG